MRNEPPGAVSQPHLPRTPVITQGHEVPRLPRGGVEKDLLFCNQKVLRRHRHDTVSQFTADSGMGEIENEL